MPPKSDAGLAKGIPTPPFPPLLPLLLPELLGVSGGVGFPGTGLWWKGTEDKSKTSISFLVGLHWIFKTI